MVTSIHRPTKATVDLSAITSNIETIKSHLPENTQHFAVVKADAYGHGAAEVAKHIKHQVDYFCVSNLDEGLELRQAGIIKPILILGVIMPEELPVTISQKITVTVASLEWLDFACSYDLTGLKVHLKLDTGMGRIGFRNSSDTKQALHRLRELGANVEGVFTHFATADETDDSYFLEQLQSFKTHLSELEQVPALVHAGNSATSLWHHEGIFNAVRLGIAIYGLNPSGQVLELPYPIKPALTLSSQIIHVKKLPSLKTIGYGATYQTKSDEYIATVPIGYADGWTRDTQNFYVLVDGNYCQIVGRISMDQMTIKLPKSYPLGTEVTLIGKNGDEAISATDIAQHRDTINYEVLCLLSQRVPRQYL
ncbi:alanine racemase [Streptococcus sp. S784/96/1]|uniref:alanine racemase n=1 Tax=Streptococcus sp. S784/96/1 TaxID=2653499 RepID=UPI001387294F|nr:alanine racemase [Streptococcus sp. S784/96/1]